MISHKTFSIRSSFKEVPIAKQPAGIISFRRWCCQRKPGARLLVPEEGPVVGHYVSAFSSVVHATLVTLVANHAVKSSSVAGTSLLVNYTHLFLGLPDVATAAVIFYTVTTLLAHSAGVSRSRSLAKPNLLSISGIRQFTFIFSECIQTEMNQTKRRCNLKQQSANEEIIEKWTTNSEPNALTGDKSDGIKSRGFYLRIYPQLQPRAKNFMYLYCLAQENYPGLSKKTKDKLPWAKSYYPGQKKKRPLIKHKIRTLFLSWDIENQA